MEALNENLIDDQLLYALLNGAENPVKPENKETPKQTEKVYEIPQKGKEQLRMGSQRKGESIQNFASSTLPKEKDSKQQELSQSQKQRTEQEEQNNRRIERRELVSSGKDTVTVITKGTRIAGNISCDCSLDVLGSVYGDIECFGNLTISGTVNGNLKAKEIYVDADRLQGNIQSEGTIKISVGTVVIGDMKGTSGIIAGAVKGNIDINGSVLLDSTAIIKGNIRAKSIQMDSGAVVEGYCSFSYASVDIDNIFE